jgi:hypothetical protein
LRWGRRRETVDTDLEDPNRHPGGRNVPLIHLDPLRSAQPHATQRSRREQEKAGGKKVQLPVHQEPTWCCEIFCKRALLCWSERTHDSPE